jgi:DNA-directed RNA polymerase subunit RPC12/RpoP
MLVCYPINSVGDGVMCERCGEAPAAIRVEFATSQEVREFDTCFRCLRPVLDRLQKAGAADDGQDLIVEHTDMACPSCVHPVDVVVLAYTQELSASDMGLRCSNCGQVLTSWARTEQQEG